MVLAKTVLSSVSELFQVNSIGSPSPRLPITAEHIDFFSDFLL